MPEFIKLVDESLAVKGRNLVINSKDLEFDHTALQPGSIVGGYKAEFVSKSVGNAYKDAPIGQPITISFDLKMKVNTITSTLPYLAVYNSNHQGDRSFGDNTIDLKPYCSNVGEVINRKIVIKTRLYAGSKVKDSNHIEFYSDYYSSNYFGISNLKIEYGHEATDWTEAPEDLEGVS